MAFSLGRHGQTKHVLSFEYNKDTQQVFLFFNSNFVREKYIAIVFPRTYECILLIVGLAINNLRLVDWLKKSVISVDDECVGMSVDWDW